MEGSFIHSTLGHRSSCGAEHNVIQLRSELHIPQVQHETSTSYLTITFPMMLWLSLCNKNPEIWYYNSIREEDWTGTERVPTPKTPLEYLLVSFAIIIAWNLALFSYSAVQMCRQWQDLGSIRVITHFFTNQIFETGSRSLGRDR